MSVNTTQLINLISHNIQAQPGTFWDSTFDISHKDPASNKALKYTFKILKFLNATVTKEPQFSYSLSNDSLKTSIDLGINICYGMDAKLIVPKPNPINFTLVTTLCGEFKKVS